MKNSNKILRKEISDAFLLNESTLMEKFFDIDRDSDSNGFSSLGMGAVIGDLHFRFRSIKNNNVYSQNMYLGSRGNGNFNEPFLTLYIKKPSVIFSKFEFILKLSSFKKFKENSHSTKQYNNLILLAEIYNIIKKRVIIFCENNKIPLLIEGVNSNAYNNCVVNKKDMLWIAKLFSGFIENTYEEIRNN
jgi:hypothetical protein